MKDQLNDYLEKTMNSALFIVIIFLLILLADNL